MHRFLIVCLLALPLTVPAVPISAADGPVALQCGASRGGHLGAGPVCSSLQSLLEARFGALQSASGAGERLLIRLELTRDEPQLLAGRLIWQAPAGSAPRRGPVVEVTANDRPLDARAGERLARGLIAVTDLPQ